MINKDLLIYNALDVSCTLEIAAVERKLIHSLGYEQTSKMTQRIIDPLIYMMTRGLLVDINALHRAANEIREKEAELQDELNSLCGRALNVNSSKDCQNYFYIEKGISPYKKITVENGKKKMTITCDDRALQYMAKGTTKRPGLREASLVQEIRGLIKMRSTYLEMVIDSDGRIRCSYNPRGSKYGRLSSSKSLEGSGMNFQNIPQEFKQFIVADPGYFFIEVDKRGAEWVVVAYASGDPRMIHIIESGQDPHAATANMMFGVDVDTIKRENKIIGHTTNPLEIEELREKHFPELLTLPFIIRNMSLRQAGKKSNHGLNYDEEFRQFALINEITETEAAKICSMYKEIYSGVPRWHESIVKQLRENRTLMNCFGRKMQLREEWGKDLWKSAYSAIPQSTVVDLINIGMSEIYEDTSPLMKDIELLMQVHDSLLFQVPITQIENAPQIISRVTEYLDPYMEYNGTAFHIGSDFKIGLNARDMIEVTEENVYEKARQLVGELPAVC